MPDNRETAQTLGDSSHEAAPRSHTRRPARSPGAGDAAFALRFVVVPIVEYVLKLAAKYPERKIAVAIPEFVEDRWYEYFLHNQRARLLQWVLLARGTK